jgi:hypothetical protein
MRFVVHYDAGMCGTDHEEVTDDSYENQNQVYDAFNEAAWEHFWQYNDESDFEDLEPENNLWVEPFDQEVHGDLL